MNRRNFSVAACAALTLGMAGGAMADAAYPAKPVRIIVGYSAGGPTDLVARMIAVHLQTRLGQPFVVDNRPGAGSNIASEAVATAPADGYTLLVAAAPLTMNSYVYKKLKFDAVKSFTPISKLSSSPGVLAVRPDLGVANVKELIALAKKEPGKLTYGTTGLGGSQHMATELLQRLAGVQLTHIPYKGASNVMTDLIAGHVDLAFVSASGAMSHLQAGKVKSLAVAGPQRLSGLPDVPTFAQAGFPAMVSDSWNGLLAPAGTPPAIVKKLHAAAVEALQSPEIKAKLESLGAIVIGSKPEEFRDDIQREVAQWGEQFKNIKIDTQ
ncbi:twin-arginine translocation pathway signal [Acidovorax carolinensis]|uniref:Twin-arginine translocation pathway signal n=1 Tax=Acidovorax carolinensis TaxID=553814 RepID=A0A240U9A4_9BURK|nr:tripartite tricarboxylate transporter substrate binding protein [Acidovorax carolinensis]ART56423.1 twin-arginine translocation pathway signal [Acidovorax carolinensis]ART57620.1 twin-arginine translocation pathway signal [Acidovorax carolinensis]